MTVVERTEGRYEVQDVEFGKVYKWCPERVVVECDCGERATLIGSETTCRCGADHAKVFRGESTDSSEDEVIHPWRYAGYREDAEIPY